MKKRCIENAPPSMLINELSKLFNDRMRQRTEAMGMAEGWRRILYHLKHNEHLTQLELVKHTHLSAPAVSVNLQKMEAAGLVSRENDPEDQRAILVQLTEQGHEADCKVIGAIRQTEQEMLAGLTPEELEQLRPILLKMIRNFTEEGME